MDTAGRLPDFVVIGAMKAATTSLDLYLALHPQIHMARPKEPRFFVDEPPPAGRWGLGLDWYRSLFVSAKSLCGEASPAYAASPSIPGVAARMAATIPQAKIIYLVREPYGRIRSQFFMDFRKQRFEGNFREYIENYPLALDCSSYGRQYEEYLSFYSKERILVVETAELEIQRQKTMSGIFRFLGVDDTFSSPIFFHKRHVGAMAPFPTPLGRKVISSAPMKAAKDILHGGAYYHLENLVLRFFAAPKPPTELPSDLEEQVKERLRGEVARLRSLSELALRSLSIP